MPKHEIQEQASTETEKSSLKGTFISVMVVGLFLLISWFGVWYLYMIR